MKNEWMSVHYLRNIQSYNHTLMLMNFIIFIRRTMKNYFTLFYFLLIIYVLPVKIFPQEKVEANFEAAEGKIFIYYEIKGDAGKEYDVKVKLKRTGDPSFELVPAVMVGDVGKGKFAGGKKTIIWHLNSDEEAMLTGEDFYFDVTAEEIIEGGGIPWYVWAGGAAVGGGVAAFLLLKKSSNDGGSGDVNLPSPPGRP